MNVLLAKEVAQGSEIVVQQWLATGEDYLTNAKVQESRAMAFQVRCMELVAGFAFPDVAHDATTVAATVNIENENRQSCQARVGRWRCVRFMQRWHCLPSSRQGERLSPLLFLLR